MLTRKQYELLMFIDERLQVSGVSPSFDEMKDALGLRSKSGVHRLITGLEERGFLRRLPHRARALEILRLPENADHAPVRGNLSAKESGSQPGKQPVGGTANGFAPNVIQGDFQMPGTVKPDDTETVSLPLYGRIAAGTPIEALRDHSNFVSLPASMIGKGEHYALEVDGDSMIEAGINDGDTVVIERCANADNGAIVVALVDNEEVTLKRLRRKGHSIALEPANKTYETRIFGPDQVQVQGRLVGLYRRY